MMANICNHIQDLNYQDYSEKGYINTFNHITPQALMTTIFSKRLSDFVADTHERRNMPELITGEFSEAQIKDLNDGAADNYLDMINNEWGQRLGKILKKEYHVNRKTMWTPEMLSNYLNDIQSYFSWSLQISFKPFRKSDEVIVRFANKINKVMEEVPLIK